MSAKSLGANKIPSPVKQCCFKVIQITLEGEMMSFQVGKGFGFRFNIVERGKGLTIAIFAAIKGRG